MACFIVPATEAVLTTIVTKILERKEQRANLQLSAAERALKESNKVAFTRKLGWLNKMLWGGSALLAFEHLWHGEIAPFFPFLTAVEKGETWAMLREMATTGVMMAALVTLAWLIMLAVSSAIEKRAVEPKQLAEEVV